MRRFNSTEIKDHCLEISIDYCRPDSGELVISHIRSGVGPYLRLSKQDAIRLAAEIQSWCETGEFIQPKKKKYAIVFEPNGYPLEVHVVLGESEERAINEFWKNKDPDTTKLIGVLLML